MNPNRTIFLQFCAEITGYSCFSLEGTGNVDSYQALLEGVLGSKQAEFYDLVKSVTDLSDAAKRSEKISSVFMPPCVYWPLVEGLISLWYLGLWTRLPDGWYASAGLPLPGPDDIGRTHVPSAAAYTEQLSYRTAGAHPPGAKPTGYGSWNLPPVFAEES